MISALKIVNIRLNLSLKIQIFKYAFILIIFVLCISFDAFLGKCDNNVRVNVFMCLLFF